MTDLAFAFGPFLSASARSSCGSVRPSKPRPPTLSIERRANDAARKLSQAKLCLCRLMVRLYQTGTRMQTVSYQLASCNELFIDYHRKTNSFALSSAQVMSSTTARLLFECSRSATACACSFALGGRLSVV